jgi:glycogen debranching enzyme
MRVFACCGRLWLMPVTLAFSAVALLALTSCNNAPKTPDLAPTNTTIAKQEAALRFSVQEGQIQNFFYRNGPVATHLVLKNAAKPRLIAAFPAGNSGIGLWLTQSGTPQSHTNQPRADWQLKTPLEEVIAPDAKSRSLYGIKTTLTLSAGSYVVAQALLSNMRVLRDYEYTGKAPDALAARLEQDAARGVLTWSRDRLDGAPGYRLSLRVLAGRIASDANGRPTLTSLDKKPLVLEVLALCGETPLTPLRANQILTQARAPDQKSLNILNFLSYQEKLLAGSWRFNTYFGRDTLMSLRLLMPSAHPDLMEAGLGSVIERLSDTGEVAHEEDIGEFALLRRQARSAQTPNAAAPLYDYKMVDDDFMLTPVLAQYWSNPAGKARMASFLARKTSNGTPYAQALLRNIDFVLSQTQPFANNPSAKTLIHLHKGEIVGEWRDSHDGLAGGKTAYNVNAIFVPAALQAITTLAKDPDILAKLPELQSRGAQAQKQATVWRARASTLFDVTLTPTQARTAITQAAKAQGLAPAAALASLADAKPLRFQAVALNQAGTPIPVLNSDEGFALLFLNPEPAAIERTLAALMRPYPAGLITDAGMVVANAAYAPASMQRVFTNQFYHGAVIWSWQQAVMAAGIARQLERTDLPTTTRQALIEAQRTLWRAIKGGGGLQTSELWSWRFANGRTLPVPFGQTQGDQTESNAAQLWSTVYLGIATHEP